MSDKRSDYVSDDKHVQAIGGLDNEAIHQLLKPESSEQSPPEPTEKNKVETLKDDLFAQWPTTWDNYNQSDLNDAYAFADDYKVFLDSAKTEREFVTESVNALEALGFKDIASVDSLQTGDKVYRNIAKKGLMAAVIGQKPATEGFNILGAHIDSPRVDLKPNPLYEDGEMALFKTHYYGGIKKYQWTTIPLALHGVVVQKDGTVVDISIGENDEDPIFMFTDLLIHLSKDQLGKSAREVISGEELNLLIGGRPYPDKNVSDRFKLAAMILINEMYGITEKDLVSSEIQIVPAGKARDLGFDRSMVAAYGHDDRVCSYPALMSVAVQENPERTAIVMLSDKEEIGSVGLTGARSDAYSSFFAEIYAKQQGTFDQIVYQTKVLARSTMLSADVTNGFDPTFPGVSDSRNNAYMGRGINLAKYTGHGGKSGASEASSEFYARVIHLFEKHGIRWQTGEIGKVDQGGGGTICLYAAELGMNVLDCGVPVLNMHAPYEVINKLDLYTTYQAYRVFIENM